MTSAELKTSLHHLIDNINDGKTLSTIYGFITANEKGDLREGIITHLSSESALAKDWNKPEEDKAWKNL